MPRIKQLEKKYMIDDLYVWILGQKSMRHIRQQEMADAIGISQQTLSYRLKNKSLTVQDLIALFELFKADEVTIIRLLKTKGA